MATPDPWNDPAPTTGQVPATQTTRPWHAVRRTLLAVVGFIIVFAPALPAIVDAYGLPTTVPWVAGALTVAAGITRVLAIPQVNQWLREHLSSLSAEGRD